VPPPFDFERAVHHALAVYYFPAMDDWKRFIVRPLAYKGFERSMREGRMARELVAPLEPGEVASYEEHLHLGGVLLGNYFAWAAEMDDFESIFSDHEVWAPIPDPREGPDVNIGTLDLRPIRYLGRIDTLACDSDNEFWVLEHRLVPEAWLPTESLVADETSIANCFEMQVAYPATAVAGTIVNELRIAGQTEIEPPDEIIERDRREMTGSRHPFRLDLLTPEQRRAWATGLGKDELDEVVARNDSDNGLFRRTVIRRSQASMARVGVKLGEEVLEQRDPGVLVPPAPSEGLCAACRFVAPCTAMESGGDWRAIMAADFRQLDEDTEDESLRLSSVRPINRAATAGAELQRRRAGRG